MNADIPVSANNIVEVIQDGDDIIIPFPDHLCEELEWNIGDTLIWSANDDGTVTVTKDTSQ